MATVAECVALGLLAMTIFANVVIIVDESVAGPLQRWRRNRVRRRATLSIAPAVARFRGRR